MAAQIGFRWPTLREAAETCNLHLATLVAELEGVNDELYEHALEAATAAAQLCAGVAAMAALQETKRP